MASWETWDCSAMNPGLLVDGVDQLKTMARRGEGETEAPGIIDPWGAYSERPSL
jgi:hypothetical protein